MQFFKNMSSLVAVISSLLCLLRRLLLLIVHLSSISSRLLPQFNPMISQHHLSSTIALVNSAWNSLFGHSEFDRSRCIEGIISSKIRRYGQNRRSSADSKEEEEEEEGAECAVCLCKIEGGDEIRELRCEHLFHSVCLDRWVGHKHRTCPLCRGSLAPHNNKRANYDQLVREEEDHKVLFFNFSSLSSRDRGRWWLR